jgi:hypothetical protein
VRRAGMVERRSIVVLGALLVTSACRSSSPADGASGEIVAEAPTASGPSVAPKPSSAVMSDRAAPAPSVSAVASAEALPPSAKPVSSESVALSNELKQLDLQMLTVLNSAHPSTSVLGEMRPSDMDFDDIANGGVHSNGVRGSAGATGMRGSGDIASIDGPSPARPSASAGSSSPSSLLPSANPPSAPPDAEPTIGGTRLEAADVADVERVLHSLGVESIQRADKDGAPGAYELRFEYKGAPMIVTFAAKRSVSAMPSAEMARLGRVASVWSNSVFVAVEGPGAAQLLSQIVKR